MSDATPAQQLTALAKSRSPEDREQLLMALADLCAPAGAKVRTPQVQSLLSAIFMSLVGDAEHDIRLALAEKLAAADWPPAELISALAFDEIEIARPVIGASPLLDEGDLIKLLDRATIEHQIEVAQRPAIGAKVVETILDHADPSVMTALAGNDTADVSPEAMGKLVEASREIAAMRSPLARHPKLATEQAERLYLWVGQSLRAAIVTRFKVDVEALDRALAEAVSDAQGALDTAGCRLSAEQAEMERRLIAKLHSSGQLRPSYLMRALREQRLSLFLTALAALGGFPIEGVRKAIDIERADVLALACLAVGVDRGAFSTLLSLVRDLNDGKPGGDIMTARRVYTTYGGERVGQAARAFRDAVRAV